MIKKIITDSGTDLNEELLKNPNIERAPFNLQLGDEVFIDDLELDRADYLHKMENYKSTPITAAPSPKYYYDVFKEAEQSFVMTISAKLSGSYNSAISAKNMITDEYKEKLIHIFDSKSGTAGQTLLTYKLNELLESGLDFDSIVTKMNEIIDNTKTIFLLESFDNLVKTGRTNQYIATIAKVLNISIIGEAVEGEIQLADKVRGRKKALARLASLVTDSKVNFSERILSISHVNSFETAEEIKNSILSKVNFKKVIIQETSGICTNYGARGGIIIAF